MWTSNVWKTFEVYTESIKKNEEKKTKKKEGVFRSINVEVVSVICRSVGKAGGGGGLVNFLHLFHYFAMAIAIHLASSRGL